MKVGREKRTQRRRERGPFEAQGKRARRRVRFGESAMNRRAKEAKRFTTEFTERTEKNTDAEFTARTAGWCVLGVS